MEWNKGFSAVYYVSVVDPVTWKDTDRIEIVSGKISRTDGGLRGSADLEFINYDNTDEQWVRVWLDARQGQDSEHVPLFTGLACAPETGINGTLRTSTAECYSVLKPASDILLQRGWYAPAWVRGTAIIGDLLSVLPAPVVLAGDAPYLTDDIVAEDGETPLTMVDRILTAIDWRMRITGDGIVEILPKADDVSGYFGHLDNDILEPKLTVTNDWYSCPNVFRAVQNDNVAVARDEDPDSFLSVGRRHREIWMEETSCNLSEGETLEAYAQRRLREEQQVAYKMSYKRRFDPGILVTDRVSISYPAQKIQGSFLITSQSIDVTHGAATSEEVVAV